MNNTNIFGERLFKIREEHEETQDQLAEAIGITRQSLSRYEISDRTPNIEIVYNIAKHYNISVDYLLGLSDIQSTNKDVENVCEVTGLDEDAVEELIYCSSDRKKNISLLIQSVPFQQALDTLQDYCKLKQEINRKEKINVFEFHPFEIEIKENSFSETADTITNLEMQGFKVLSNQLDILDFYFQKYTRLLSEAIYDITRQK